MKENFEEERKGDLMTGEEFLNKVRQMDVITDIHWSIEGDYFYPDEVKVVIIADNEEIKITYPRPGKSVDDDFIQKASIGLVINKFIEQIGKDYRTDIGKDIVEAVNYSIKQL